MNLNIVTSRLWEEYRIQLNESKVKHEVVLSHCKSMMELLILKIHDSEKKIEHSLRKGKSIKIRQSCHFASVSFNIRNDGASSLNLKIQIKSTKEFESKFLLNKLKPDFGFVYFIKSEYGFKIGKTKNIDRRLSEFGVKLPFEVSLYGYIRTNNYNELELELHKLLKETRLNGEWFDLTDYWDALDLFLEINEYELIKLEVDNG